MAPTTLFRGDSRHRKYMENLCDELVDSVLLSENSLNTSGIVSTGKMIL